MWDTKCNQKLPCFILKSRSYYLDSILDHFVLSLPVYLKEFEDIQFMDKPLFMLFFKLIFMLDLNSFKSIHFHKIIQNEGKIYPLMSTENKTKNVNCNHNRTCAKQFSCFFNLIFPSNEKKNHPKFYIQV